VQYVLLEAQEAAEHYNHIVIIYSPQQNDDDSSSSTARGSKCIDLYLHRRPVSVTVQVVQDK